MPLQPEPKENNQNLNSQSANIPSADPPVLNNQPIANLPKRGKLIKAVMIIGLIIFAAAIIFIIKDDSKKSISQVSAPNTCINSTIQVGSSGQCVSDLQTMANFLETDNLNECAFNGKQILNVDGSFDAITQSQVKVLQNWLICYNKQEGAPNNITASGIVNTATWGDICTYAYIYPKEAGQSSSPYYKASIVAGKNAGC